MSSITKQKCVHILDNKLCTMSCNICGYCLKYSTYLKSKNLYCIDCWNNILTEDEKSNGIRVIKDNITSKGLKKNYSEKSITIDIPKDKKSGIKMKLTISSS
jgi:hypothetical protein